MFGSKSMRLTAKAGGYFIMTGAHIEALKLIYNSLCSINAAAGGPE